MGMVTKPVNSEVYWRLKELVGEKCLKQYLARVRHEIKRVAFTSIIVIIRFVISPTSFVVRLT